MLIHVGSLGKLKYRLVSEGRSIFDLSLAGKIAPPAGCARRFAGRAHIPPLIPGGYGRVVIVVVDEEIVLFLITLFVLFVSAEEIPKFCIFSTTFDL